MINFKHICIVLASRAKETMRSFSLVSLVDLACGFAQANFYDKGEYYPEEVNLLLRLQTH